MKLKVQQNDTKKLIFNSPNSSAIKKVEYNRRTKDLDVTFQSGGTYEYPNVDAEIVEGWLKASSTGQYFHQKIKRYSAVKIWFYSINKL